MSKNLKLVLFFTVVVAVAVMGYLYNDNRNTAHTLENMPATETNVVANTTPTTGEMPAEVVVTPEIKAEVVTPATEVAVRQEPKSPPVAPTKPELRQPYKK